MPTNGPPYHLAILFGLLISLALYLIFLRPDGDEEDGTEDVPPGDDQLPE